jgi:DNA segregation ATPase FtsK/SpoIIIE, S-DNA-T family
MKPIRIVLSPTRSRPFNVFLGLMLLLASLLVFLALATWRASDPSLNTASDPVFPHAARNWIGVFGAYASDLLLQSFGLTAFLFPLCLGGIGWTWLRSRPGGSAILRSLGILLAAAFLPALFGLMPWHWHWLHLVPVEGVVGMLVAGLLVSYLNIQGAWVVAFVLALAGIYLASAVSFWELKEILQNYWLHLRAALERWHNWRQNRAEARAELRAERDRLNGVDADPPVHEPAPKAEPRAPGFFARLFGRRTPEADPADLLDEIPAFRRREVVQQSDEIPVVPPVRRSSIWERDDEETAAHARPAVAEKVTPIRPDLANSRLAAPRFVDTRLADARPGPTQTHFDPPPAPSSRHEEEIAIHDRADADLRTVTVAPKNLSGFKLPSSTLLHSGEGPQTVREEELREEAKVLVEKCAEFDVRGQVVQINPGPMVTTYEFKPEAGVKYSRVTGLADDLCLAMRAESILIERMPGKSTVGIQVPNHERETIHLREVIESETFARAKSRLTLSMGKDINGRIVTADLASMPHVLIAGSTGSGKSVAINAMIMSLLYRTTPAQVRLILVDPKRVELGMYEGIPHLFTPIITEPKLAANALRNAVREMERRLKLLASRSVRNIDQYNKLFESSAPSLFGPEDGQEEDPLPYIVIIIDELADLMMLDRANVEESITRLAQMARAVGIHLILATQRPSVDVITGLIKANVPTRISFRLATKVDSRTILDTNGAEALLGRGDMLFLPPGTSRLLRLHAPYVSEKETAAVVEFWKEQGTAEYVEGFLDSPKDERQAVDGANDDPDENDPLFDDAVRLVFEFGKASTSLLQRRLRIGYGRAAHLIDLMERDGLVGPADGSRPRELLKAPHWLHEVSALSE